MQSDIYNDTSYLKNNPTWHEEDASFKANKIIQLLNRNEFRFESICEVGCGSGEILVQLASEYEEVAGLTGYDISKDAIGIAKQKETDRLKFECKDIAEVAKEKIYDLVLVIDVIEHIEDYFSFLDAISAHGRFTVFHIPLDISVWSLFREGILLESLDRVGHIHNFTEDFVERVLLDRGFKVVDKMYTEPIYRTDSFKESLISLVRKTLFKINKRFCTKTMGGYSLMLLTENVK